MKLAKLIKGVKGKVRQLKKSKLTGILRVVPLEGCPVGIARARLVAIRVGVASLRVLRVVPADVPLVLHGDFLAVVSDCNSRQYHCQHRHLVGPPGKA